MKTFLITFLSAGILFLNSCGSSGSGDNKSVTTSEKNRVANVTTVTAMPCKFSPCKDPGETQPCPAGDCSDSNYQKSLVDCHAIAKDCFDTILKCHGSNAPSFTKSRAQLISMVDGVDCSQYHYHLNGNATDLVKDNGLPAQGSGITNSMAIALIRGLLKKIPDLDTLELFSYTRNSVFIAYRALDANKNPIYWGDVTELIPTPVTTASLVKEYGKKHPGNHHALQQEVSSLASQSVK